MEIFGLRRPARRHFINHLAVANSITESGLIANQDLQAIHFPAESLIA